MKKIKLVKIFAAFILALTLFGSLSTFQKADASSSTKATVTTHYYKSKKFLKYPQVSGLKSKSAQNKINASFLSAVKKSYSGYLQLMKDEARDKKTSWCKQNPEMCKYSSATSYKTKYNSNGKLSILYYDYAYTGGAHGMTGVTSYNFSLTSGRQYKINDILKTSANYTKVKDYTYKYFRTHEPYKSYVYSKSDYSVNKNTQFYYGSSGAIYLVFQEYEVAAYAYGNPAIKIPNSVYQ
jgi:hypothetical protein